EVLGITEGEPAAASRLPHRVGGVAALPHPRDDPGLGGGGPRPVTVLDRDEPIIRPALQGRRRYTGDPARLRQGDRAGLIVRVVGAHADLNLAMGRGPSNE